MISRAFRNEPQSDVAVKQWWNCEPNSALWALTLLVNQAKGCDDFVCCTEQRRKIVSTLSKLALPSLDPTPTRERKGVDHNLACCRHVVARISTEFIQVSFESL